MVHPRLPNHAFWCIHLLLNNAWQRHAQLYDNRSAVPLPAHPSFRGFLSHLLSYYFVASIEQWLGPGRCCPICHIPLPLQLLKLYYEPQQDCVPDAAISGASADASAGADDTPSPTSESGEPMSAEVTQLRRKLASSTKVSLSLAYLLSLACSALLYCRLDRTIDKKARWLSTLDAARSSRCIRPSLWLFHRTTNVQNNCVVSATAFRPILNHVLQHKPELPSGDRFLSLEHVKSRSRASGTADLLLLYLCTLAMTPSTCYILLESLCSHEAIGADLPFSYWV